MHHLPAHSDSSKPRVVQLSVPSLWSDRALRAVCPRSRRMGEEGSACPGSTRALTRHLPQAKAPQEPREARAGSLACQAASSSGLSPFACPPPSDARPAARLSHSERTWPPRLSDSPNSPQSSPWRRRQGKDDRRRKCKKPRAAAPYSAQFPPPPPAVSARLPRGPDRPFMPSAAPRMRRACPAPPPAAPGALPPPAPLGPGAAGGPR